MCDTLFSNEPVDKARDSGVLGLVEHIAATVLRSNSGGIHGCRNQRSMCKTSVYNHMLPADSAALYAESTGSIDAFHIEWALRSIITELYPHANKGSR